MAKRSTKFDVLLYSVATMFSNPVEYLLKFIFRIIKHQEEMGVNRFNIWGLFSKPFCKAARKIRDKMRSWWMSSSANKLCDLSEPRLRLGWAATVDYCLFTKLLPLVIMA